MLLLLLDTGEGVRKGGAGGEGWREGAGGNAGERKHLLTACVSLTTADAVGSGLLRELCFKCKSLVI